jgi:poly(A) polymerase
LEPNIIERARHPISRRDIHPNVLKVLYRLIHAGHTAFLVGGGVRDLMLGRKPKDFDVATSAHPQQVRELFRNSRLIGRRFRLVHVFFGPQNIEVATFRRQAEEVVNHTDLLIRHDNTFGTAEEDAFRRDFTVNALFYDPRTFGVVDYVGGVADLGEGLIRTIGDPELRVREDPVRMLRAVRFAAKLGFDIEAATRRAIERHHREILKASPPRLVEEIYRTLCQPGGAHALALMEQLGLLAVLLPPLSAHLQRTGADAAHTVTAHNLQALGAMIEAAGRHQRGDPSHGFVLACLFLDLYRYRMSHPGHRHHRGPHNERHLEPHRERELDLRDELRERGFARGDTEHMRLLLDAFDLLIAPSRRTRKLSRRPYFDEARRLFEMVAHNYGADPAALQRFLDAEDGRQAHGHAAGHAALETDAPPGRQRRRGRRGGRGRRGRGHRHDMRHPAVASVAAGTNGAAQEAAPRDQAVGATVPDPDVPVATASGADVAGRDGWRSR